MGKAPTTKKALDVDSDILPLINFPADPDANTPTRKIELSSWLRLWALFFVGAVASGLMPGQALFNELFAKSGVAASQCGADEELPCAAQTLRIAYVINVRRGICAPPSPPRGRTVVCRRVVSPPPPRF